MILPDQKSDEQIKSNQEPSYLPCQQDLVAKIDFYQFLRQDHREDWCVTPTVSTIFVFFLLLPSSDEEEDNIAVYENKKFGCKKLLRRWTHFFQGSVLFIDEDTRLSPIQILNHSREVSSYPAIYGILNQTNINRLCYTISFIMIPGSYSLNFQLFAIHDASGPIPKDSSTAPPRSRNNVTNFWRKIVPDDRLVHSPPSLSESQKRRKWREHL